MSNQKFKNRVIFWSIILIAILIVFIMSGMSAIYQTLNQRAKATLIAIPTTTAEALEAIYQKGLANINIGRWQEAKRELDVVFEINPNYKDVQTKLKEVEAKITELSLTAVQERETNQELAPVEVKEISPTKGIVAYYPFEGNADDASGNGNNGRVFGATLTEDRFGKTDDAYRFDGDDYIEIQGRQFNFEDELSVSLWVNPETYQVQYAGIIDKTHHEQFNGHPASWVLQKADHSTNGYYFGYGNGSSWSNLYGERYRLDLEADIWSHIAIVKQGANIKYFLNGELVLEEKTMFPNVFSNGDLPLWLGGVKGTSRYFRGLIDDIVIFNHALSEAEIRQLYEEVR
jgi:hypothetical protein